MAVERIDLFMLSTAIIIGLLISGCDNINLSSNEEWFCAKKGMDYWKANVYDYELCCQTLNEIGEQTGYRCFTVDFNEIRKAKRIEEECQRISEEKAMNLTKYCAKLCVTEGN